MNIGAILKLLFSFPIIFYRFIISPLLIPSCRFVPSCSEYAMDAIKYYGVVKGSYLTLKRILKCNPCHKGGYDPIRRDTSKKEKSC